MCRIFNVQHTEIMVHISVRHTEMTEHIKCVAVLLGVSHSYSMCRFLTLCVADPIWGVCCSSYTLSRRLPVTVPQRCPRRARVSTLVFTQSFPYFGCRQMYYIGIHSDATNVILMAVSSVISKFKYSTICTHDSLVFILPCLLLL